MKKKIIICIILIVVLIGTIIGLIGINNLNKPTNEPEPKKEEKDDRVKIDDYIDTNYEETKKILEEKGFTVEVIKIITDEKPKDTVLNTLPNPSELVKVGQKIILYVADVNPDKALIEVKYNELLTMLNNKESFILVLSQTTCGHCANYKPTLKELLSEHNLTAYYIEVNLFSDSERSKMKKIFNYEVTPTTIFIKDGKEIEGTRFTGNKDKKTIETFLREYKYIE